MMTITQQSERHALSRAVAGQASAHARQMQTAALSPYSCKGVWNHPAFRTDPNMPHLIPAKQTQNCSCGWSCSIRPARCMPTSSDATAPPCGACETGCGVEI